MPSVSLRAAFGVGRRGLLVLFAALCVLSLSAGVARAADDAAALREKLDVVRAETVKNNENIAKMKAELDASAKATPPRMPDATKLHPYATATGDRTAAYWAAPEYIRKLIDEFEADRNRNLVQAGVLALGGGNPIAQYRIEITRSTEFGKLLQREESETLAALALALPEEQRTQERMEHEAMMNDWLARLTRKTDEWIARAQKLVEGKRADAMRLPINDIPQTGPEIEKLSLQKCREARAALQKAIAYGVAAADGEAQVTATLATARTRADGCKTDQDAAAVEDLYQEAKRLAAKMQRDRDAAEAAHAVFLDAALYAGTVRDLAQADAERFLAFRNRLADVIRNIRELLGRMAEMAQEGVALLQEIETSRLHYTTTFPGAQARFEGLQTRVTQQLDALETREPDPDKVSLRNVLRRFVEQVPFVERAGIHEQNIADALADCGNPAQLDKLRTRCAMCSRARCWNWAATRTFSQSRRSAALARSRRRRPAPTRRRRAP